jgi:small subunit ribosomal protein S8
MIGDFLTIIRNGVARSKQSVVVQYSRVNFAIATILKDEGFVGQVVVEGDAKKDIRVFLKYVDGESAIHAIERVSKPSRRVYKGHDAFDPVIGGLGLSLVTTNRGLITNKQARECKVGGEVICTVW